ncbi:IS3 family transposase [Treponema sp.]
MKKGSDRACPEKGIKVKLKGLTPLQFRNQSLKSA